MPIRLHPDELPTINLTSMIDVLFLLIIFFMVGSHFGDPEQHISVQLPRANASQASPAGATKVVNVLRDGSTIYEGQRLTPDQLTQALRAVKAQVPQLHVDFRVDGESKAEQFMPVMVAVSNLGANVHLRHEQGSRR